MPYRDHGKQIQYLRDYYASHREYWRKYKPEYYRKYYIVTTSYIEKGVCPRCLEVGQVMIKRKYNRKTKVTSLESVWIKHRANGLSKCHVIPKAMKITLLSRTL